MEDHQQLKVFLVVKLALQIMEVEAVEVPDKQEIHLHKEMVEMDSKF